MSLVGVGFRGSGRSPLSLSRLIFQQKRFVRKGRFTTPLDDDQGQGQGEGQTEVRSEGDYNSRKQQQQNFEQERNVRGRGRDEGDYGHTAPRGKQYGPGQVRSEGDYNSRKQQQQNFDQGGRDEGDYGQNSPRGRQYSNEGDNDHDRDRDLSQGQPPMEKEERKRTVRKFMKMATSTYGEPLGGGKVGGDNFMSLPYVKGARRLSFEGGDDAGEEGFRRKIDPAMTSVVLFPGQGTQHVGMCGDVSTLPRYIQSLYEIASSILDYDLLALCSQGPREKLDMTVHAQPAVFVSSLAALERLRDEDPHSVENCVATAGFSVGEIAALVFAGAMAFEDGLRLVKVRAEAMQLAGEISPSGMASVLYGADSKLNYALVVAKEWCRREHNIENPVCSVANYLFPHCKVVAGHTQALQFLEENYRDFNLRRVRRLPVSGAFHTDLMAPAIEPVRSFLQGLTFNRPRMLVFSNVTGRRYHNSEELVKLLSKQMVKPVMWEQTIQMIYQRPKEAEYPFSFEVGPGRSLSTVLKNVNNKAFLRSKTVPPFPSPTSPSANSDRDLDHTHSTSSPNIRANSSSSD